MWHKSSLFLAVICNLALWVDVFTEPGYLTSFIGIPVKIFLLLAILFSSLYYLTSARTTSPGFKYFLTLVSLASIVYFSSVTIEGLESQGYIYNHLHFRPESLLYPVLSLILLAQALYLKIKGNPLLRYMTYVLYASLIFYFLRQLPIVMVQASSLVKTIVIAPSATYDDKMRSQWGSFYDYMVFLKQNLPDGGTTLGIPPQQNPWLLYGNGMLVQSFVYPTRVINLDATGSAAVMPQYIMQLPDFPTYDPATGSAKWGLIKL